MEYADYNKDRKKGFTPNEISNLRKICKNKNLSIDIYRIGVIRISGKYFIGYKDTEKYAKDYIPIHKEDNCQK